MPLIELKLNVNHSNTRIEIRKQLVNTFLDEFPGKGKGDFASKYHYFVETLSDGRKVYLSRPAKNIKGFDFRIHVENMKFTTNPYLEKNAPLYQNIVDDLILKKIASLNDYKKLYNIIELLFNNKPVDLFEHQNLYSVGYKVDMLLCVIKWYFIQQDMNYWNYSGREMLMKSIPLP